MALQKRPRFKDASLRRFFSTVLLTFLGIVLLIFLHRTISASGLSAHHSDEAGAAYKRTYSYSKLNLHKQIQGELSVQLQKRNELPPKNLDLYPSLAKDHVPVVLYVHNRPQYLKVVVKSLSQVVGINETILIVSHDGYFEEMNEIVEGIKFCQVKQIFTPYSPHIFSNSFPSVSPNDCKGKDDVKEKNCIGDPDQYGNHRSPKIVSLKHHWWWMMNTVWNGLKEMKRHSGHILFIEEDHFIFPNAYRNLQLLIALKPKKCPGCYAVNLAPSDVKLKGEGLESLIAERMGNVGYAFNRTVWRKIHEKSREFCNFDEYNWDITMWTTVYPSFGVPVYSLRGPRTSAVHFGKCGLHQGSMEGACIDNGLVDIRVQDNDKVVNINTEWGVFVYEQQQGYQAGFKGWGGWGDKRDRELCLSFSNLYNVQKQANYYPLG